MLWIVIYVVFCCYHVSEGASPDKCDADTFHKPYVRLYKKRASNAPLKQLDSSGFLDLTDSIDHYLCINGPAVLYRDVTYEDELSSTKRRIASSTNGTDAGDNDDGKELSDDVLAKLIAQVDALQHAIDKDDGSDNPSAEAISKLLAEVEKTLDEIESKSGFDSNELPDSDNNVDEGPKKTPSELLEGMITETKESKEAIDTLNADLDAASKDKSPEILTTVILGLENAKILIDNCANDTNSDCKSASTEALTSLMEEIKAAKKKIEALNPVVDEDFSDPSAEMLGTFLEDLEDATDSKGSSHANKDEESKDESLDNADETKKSEDNEDETKKSEDDAEETKKSEDTADETKKPETTDDPVELLGSMLKEVTEAKHAIDELNKEVGANDTDPSPAILGEVISHIEKAKSLFKKCGNNSTDKDCKSHSEILKTLLDEIASAKKKISELSPTEAGAGDDDLNPSDVILASILEEISFAKATMDSTSKNDAKKVSNTKEASVIPTPLEPSMEHIMRKILEYVETAVSHLESESGSNNELNPSSKILEDIFTDVVSAIEKCSHHEACNPTSELASIVKKVSDAKVLIDKLHAEHKIPSNDSTAEVLTKIIEVVEVKTKVTHTKDKKEHFDDEHDGTTSKKDQVSTGESKVDSKGQSGRSIAGVTNVKKAEDKKIQQGRRILGRRLLEKSRARRHNKIATKTQNPRDRRSLMLPSTKRYRRASSAKKIAIYKDGEFEIYNHECFVLNRAVKDMFTSTGFSMTQMILNKSTELTGKKTFGITLIGEPDDYTKEALYQFMGNNFEYYANGQPSLEPGTSFITISKRHWCHNDNELQVTLKPDPTSSGVVCRHGGDPDNDRYFPAGKTKSDYNWRVCNRPPPILGDGSSTTTDPTITYDPFSTLDKNKLSRDFRHGSVGVKHPPPNVPAFMPSYLAADFRGYDDPDPNTRGIKAVNKTEVYPSAECKNGTTSKGSTGAPAGKNVPTCTMEVDHCSEVPHFDPNACAGATPDRDPCDFIVPVFNITEDPPTPKNDEIEWKSNILNLIDSIFNQICTKVNPQMSPQVSRVIMYYLNLEHAANPTLNTVRRKDWDFLESELLQCNENAEEMVFSYTSTSGTVIPSNTGVLPQAGKRRKRKDSEETASNSGLIDIVTDLDENRLKRKVGGVESSRRPDFFNFLLDDDDDELRFKRANNDNSTNATDVNLDRPVHEVFEEPLNPDYYIYPDNVTVFLFNDNFPSHRGKRDVKNSGHGKAVPLYYFEDAAELNEELSVPIDLHFKIMATVAGYCNLFYQARKSETFPRLYSMHYQDFLTPLEEKWLHPSDITAMKFLFSEYITEAVMKWIDSCLEGSYHVGRSPTFRPPRPVIIREKSKLVANYFIDEPPHRINFRRVGGNGVGR